MAFKQQSVAKIQGILEEITEGFQRTIFNQHNLLALAKERSIDDPTIEALVISIDRFNDDLFGLYERLRDLEEFEASKGGAA